MSELATSYRTHTLGELTAKDVPDAKAGEPSIITLAGSVDRREDDGSVLLRDAYGRMLVRPDGAALPHVADRFAKLALEDVVQVKGVLAPRPSAAKDPKLATGAVLLLVSDIEVLSAAAGLPDGVLTAADVRHEDRLAYRQLYLRRDDVQARMRLRSRLAHEAREFLCDHAFLEIETPQLFWYDPVATGPEPVPVRGGRAFALPSGPVVLDQYVKAGQFDRFFQFVRITRREEHPSPMHAQEYTGLDLNMCYVDVKDFCTMVELLLAHVCKTVLGKPLKTPFPSLTYDEVMRRYGTDKPDLRFGLELTSLPPETVPGEVVRALRLPAKDAAIVDKDLDTLLAGALVEGLPRPRHPDPKAKPPAGLITHVKLDKGGKLDGPGAAVLAGKPKLIEMVKAVEGDLIIICRGSDARVATRLGGAARHAVGRAARRPPADAYAPVWITNYPYFTFDYEVNDFVPDVVVFSSVATEKDLEIAVEKPERRHEVRANAFDLVLNGVEVASAYLGNSDLALQRVVWRHLLQMGNPDLFRLRAPIESHRFGIPPHGGMNIGFDRLVATLIGARSLDEVMAFPKSLACEDPLLGAPGPMPKEALAYVLDDVPEETVSIEALNEEVANL